MGIKVALEHRTTYHFDRLVTIHPHVVRLRPAPHSRTKIEAYSLTIEPADHFINWQQDPFGNFMARLVFPERANELSITVGLVADLTVVNPFDFFIEEYAEHYGFVYPADLESDLEPYLRPVDEREPGSGPGPLVTNWLKNFTIQPDTAIVDFLVQLNGAIQHDVGYSVRMEPGVQTPDYTLSSAIGSCRDSAWLLVSLLRELGLAARFVSGYLVQLTSDIPSLDGPSGPTADFTDLHAWAEVYIPGAGWIGMDPTSGLFAGEGHIPLSATPHPSTAAAITGSTGIAQTTLEYSNVVRRIHEDPRVTLPYTPNQWSAVQSVGALVDKRLEAGDVRMTMGGEPTFVSIDDGTSAEWTIDADGPKKRERAGVLAERLRKIYAPGGVVHRGQGKWYPGEPLPRWQIALHWRSDGVPLWSDPALLADPWATETGRRTGRRQRPSCRRDAGSGPCRPLRRRRRRILRIAGQPGPAGLRGRPGQAGAAGPDAGRRAGGHRPGGGQPGRAAGTAARAGRVGHRAERIRAAASTGWPPQSRRPKPPPTTRRPASGRRPSAGAAPTGGCAAVGSCC